MPRNLKVADKSLKRPSCEFSSQGGHQNSLNALLATITAISDWFLQSSAALFTQHICVIEKAENKSLCL